jgi:hypothetical protein
MSDEGTTVQKQGEIIAVQPTKTGWTEIHLQETGKQYPYKASTKIEAIIEQAQAALFQEAVLTAKEVDSGNPNPNRPGYNYINRTAMKVEAGGTISVPAASASGPAGGSRTATSDETRGSIERQVIVKEMVSHYPGIDKLSVDGWWGLVGELEEFVANGVPKVAPVVDERGVLADDIPFN